MDQLNRGVKVEGLMLPPGITLTRVDPTSAEGMRAKKEAISRVSEILFNLQTLMNFFTIQMFIVADITASSGSISTAIGVPTATAIYSRYADAIEWHDNG